MSEPGAPPILSRKARRAFNVLGEELKRANLLHYVMFYDPDTNGVVTLHTFEDHRLLERNLRHVADRIRSGEHQRTRHEIDPNRPGQTPDALKDAIRRAVRGGPREEEH